jgi:hypothetical protein
VLSVGSIIKTLSSGTITLSSGASLSGLSFNKTNLACATPAIAAGVSSCAFVRNGGAYGITITGTAADITLSGNTFSGYAGADGSTGTEAIFVNIATGSMTINITGGGSIPSIRTAGCVVTISAPTTVTFTGFETGSDVVILTAGTSTILQSADAVSGTSYAWQYQGAQTVDVGFIKPGFKVKYLRALSLGTSDSTIPVSMQTDLVYS